MKLGGLDGKVEGKQLTLAMVYGATGLSAPSEVAGLYKILRTGSFGDAYSAVRALVVDKGRSCADLVRVLHDSVLADSIRTPSSWTQAQFAFVVQELAAIEYRLSIGASDRIQSAALVATFTNPASK